MKPNDLILRCLAMRDDDASWFAICLDLNLYARADSFDEVKAKLNAFIREYLQEALTVDADHIGDLIPRRAPLYFWLLYFAAWCKHSLHRATQAKKFTLHLPVVPAA